MRYRDFGKLDWMISELSAGVLRTEEAVAHLGAVQRDERVAALRFAIDNGVNYINLGYPLYFNDPCSACSYVKEALSGGYRDKVKVAVNIPLRGVATQRDLDEALENQLRLFDLDYADFCILDQVDRVAWKQLMTLGAASCATRIISSGKAGHIGFTFHDDAYYLKEITETCPDWTVMQIALSIVDYKHHPGVGGLKFAWDNDIAVIATDCTKAGRLLTNIPENVQAIWDKAQPIRTPEEWSIRWVLNLTEVSSVLLDFISVQHVKERLSFAEGVSVGDADVWETLQAARAREGYYAHRYVQCTACRCCMPCPLGIDAPRIIELYNDGEMFTDDRIPRLLYNKENHQNIACSQCGLCQLQCPKHFPIPEIVAGAQSKYSDKLNH